MGGKSSSLKQEHVINIVSEAIYNLTQNCKSDISNTNTIEVRGNNNIIDNVNQTIKVNFSMDCVSRVMQDSKLTNKMTDQVMQALKDSGVALTGFADGGQDRVENKLKQNIRNTVTTNVIQNCLIKIASENKVKIVGSGNKLKDIQQSSTVSAISKCLSTNKTFMSGVNNITNIANQNLETTEKNPLSFISDIFTGLSKSMMMIVGIVVLIIAAVIIGAIFLLKSG